MCDSWYNSQVHVLLKEAAFEPYSAVRHATKLSESNYTPVPPVLFLYTDGGPDHNSTHVAVQLSVIALFLYMCIMNTSLPVLEKSSRTDHVHLELRSSVHRVDTRKNG